MEIKEYDTLPSTNLAAVEAARAGCAAFYTISARRQTAGRGRKPERRFYSPEGGTYFSTVLRPALPPAFYGRITPAAAVAVRRAVAELSGVQAKIKWVNDLYTDAGKICGISAESGRDVAGNPYVVLGIGINTGNTVFPPELRGKAASIPYTDRAALMARVLAHLTEYEALIRTSSWLEEYRANCLYLGETVRVMGPTGERPARALRVLEDGALLVEWEDGRREALYGGEISVRGSQSGEN